MSSDPSNDFPLGCTVRIKAGIFADYVGRVHSLDATNQFATVVVNMFGLWTPVDVAFGDLERTKS
jgi:transcription antitermination factor NusG